MSTTILAILVLLAIGLMGLRIANQYQRAVIFRLGRYKRTRGPGLYWIIPLIEWQQTVDLRINTTAVEQQETITKDNVPIKVNAAHPGWVRTEMGGEEADLDISEGGKTSAWLATLPADGPTGGYFHLEQRLPW